jgi:hypothetical protein
MREVQDPSCMGGWGCPPNLKIPPRLGDIGAEKNC